MNDATLPVCRAAELEMARDRARWLIEPWWGRAAVGFLAGAPKLGKTWLALDLALSVATATPFLGRFPVADPGEVLVYLAEDHPAEVRQRLAGLSRHRGLELEDVAIHVITAPTLRLDLERDRERLTATVKALGPKLLVLDPLVRLHRRNENDVGEVAELLAFLRALERDHDLAIVVVHHLRKHGAARAGQALRGSGDLHAWTDSALYLRPHLDRIALVAEHRSAPAPEPIEIRLVSRPDGSATRFEVIDAARADEAGLAEPTALVDRLIAVLQASPRPLSRFDLRRALRVNNQRLGAALAGLEDRQAIVREPHGWRAPSEARAG